MGQAHNLQQRLFSATPYFRQSISVTPPEEDPDDAFMRRLTESEDRGTHLRMFERADVLAFSPSAEHGPHRTKEDFVANKLVQSKREAPTGSGQPPSAGENTTYESIRQHGVHNPVLVRQRDTMSGNPMYELQHGHHRVYSANEINPSMEIPLVHTLLRRGRDATPQEIAMSRSASEQSMGLTPTSWRDPTMQPRYRILT